MKLPITHIFSLYYVLDFDREPSDFTYLNQAVHVDGVSNSRLTDFKPLEATVPLRSSIQLYRNHCFCVQACLVICTPYLKGVLCYTSLFGCCILLTIVYSCITDRCICITFRKGSHSVVELCAREQ